MPASLNSNNIKNFNEAGDLLPIQDKNGTPTLDSRSIAEKLNNDHESIMRLISKHKAVIEKDFGVIGFEIGKPQKRGGRPTKSVCLNEGQALFLTTLSKNTKEAISLKSLIVKSFMVFRGVVSDYIEGNKPLQNISIQDKAMHAILKLSNEDERTEIYDLFKEILLAVDNTTQIQDLSQELDELQVENKEMKKQLRETDRYYRIFLFAEKSRILKKLPKNRTGKEIAVLERAIELKRRCKI